MHLSIKNQLNHGQGIECWDGELPKVQLKIVLPPTLTDKLVVSSKSQWKDVWHMQIFVGLFSVVIEIQIDLNFGVLLEKTWTMTPRAITLSNDPEKTSM